MKLENKPYMFVAEHCHFFAGQGGDQRSIHTDCSLVCPVQCTKYMQQCTFPGSRGSDDGSYFTLFDLDIHALENFYRIVPFMYIFSCDHATKHVFERSNILKSHPPAKPTGWITGFF